MAISEYFTDEDLCSQLRLQFDENQQYDMDFRTVFSHIVDRGGDLYLELRGKHFSIDKITGTVTLLNPSDDDDDEEDEE